jgi:hypothetical protein
VGLCLECSRLIMSFAPRPCESFGQEARQTLFELRATKNQRRTSQNHHHHPRQSPSPLSPFRLGASLTSTIAAITPTLPADRRAPREPQLTSVLPTPPVIYHVSAKRNQRIQPERARTKKAPPQLAAADWKREQKKTRHWGESGGIFTESSQKTGAGS